MREQEAADYLGVSVRTLYRYRKTGKLPYREVKGVARPVLHYEERDLQRLKGVLQKRRERSKKPEPPAPKRPRVTFGLPPKEHEALLQEAARYGMSGGEYARRLTREGLESHFRAEAEELRQAVERGRTESRKLRTEVASAFEAVLEYVGLTPEQAQQWVTENLR